MRLVHQCYGNLGRILPKEDRGVAECPLMELMHYSLDAH